MLHMTITPFCLSYTLHSCGKLIGVNGPVIHWFLSLAFFFFHFSVLQTFQPKFFFSWHSQAVFFFTSKHFGSNRPCYWHRQIHVWNCLMSSKIPTNNGVPAARQEKNPFWRKPEPSRMQRCALNKNLEGAKFLKH